MPAVDITVFFAITGFDVECATIFLISSILSAAFYRKTKEQRDLYTLMSVTQTSLVRDLKSGPAEVNGRVIVKDQTLSSPWSNRKCAYYRFHVEQDSSNGWMTCIDDTSLSSFFITDETGEIEIICNDGKMDLVASSLYRNPYFYKNITTTSKKDGVNQWIGFSLESKNKTCNRDAVGSIVSIHYLD